MTTTGVRKGPGGLFAWAGLEPSGNGSILCHESRRLSAAWRWALCAMLAATVPATAGSLGYRGFNNSGIYPASGLLRAWPKEGPELLWKRDVGLGYCSPTVADGRVYVVHGVGQCALSVFSLEDGKPLGNVALGSAAWKRFGGSRSTPLIAEGVVVATLPNADFFGIDLEKKEVRWKLNAWKDLGSGKGNQGWGLPESPALHNSTVILNPVSRDNITPPLAAIDIRDGRLVWGMDPGRGKNYSAADLGTACFRHGGRDLVAAATWCYVFCAEADTGKLLWEFPSLGEKTMTPCYSDGYLLVSAGREMADGGPDPLPPEWPQLTPRERMGRQAWSGDSLIMLRLSDDGTTYRALWVRPWGQDFSHAVVLNRRVYVFGSPKDPVERSVDGAVPPAEKRAGGSRSQRSLLCLDAETGALLAHAPAGSYGHIVSADGMVYVVDLVRADDPDAGEKATCLVPRLRLIRPTETGFDVTGEFRPLTARECGSGRHRQEQEFVANVPPVIANGRLFFLYNQLLAFDLRDKTRFAEEPARGAPASAANTAPSAWAEECGRFEADEETRTLLRKLDAWLEEDRMAAVAAVVRLPAEKRKQAIPALVKAFGLRDALAWRAQTTAAMCLQDMGGLAAPAAPALQEAVLAALERRDLPLAALAFDTFQSVSAGGVTDAFAGKLAGLLAHKDHDVRRVAAGLLNRAEMNLPRGTVSLAEAVASDNGHLVREAAAALRRMGPAARDGAAVLERALMGAVASQQVARAALALDLLEAVDRQAAKRATRGLAALAADANPDVVTVALETLTRTEAIDPEAAPVLIPLLSSTNGLWVTQSATALGRLGADAAAAVPGLVKLLDDERIETRRAAAGVLAKFGGLAGAALPALFRGTGNPDRRYSADCLAAIKAIGVKPDEDAVRVLDGITRRGDPSMAVLAVEALATMGTNAPAAVESLRQAVGHRDRAVREAAFAGLCALNSPPISELARMLSGGEDAQRTAWAAEKTGALGPAAGVAGKALLDTMARGHDLYVLSAAAGALKAIGSEDAESARRLLVAADRTFLVAELMETALKTLVASNAPPAVQEEERQNRATCRQAESVVVEFLPWIRDPDTPETRLRAVVVDPPSRGAFERRSATAWLYTPEPSFIGQDAFKWKADDGQAESRVAGGVISVTGDTQPPVIVSVQALGSNDEVVVKLNEPILRDGAEDKANFAIDRGAEIREASLDRDGTAVTLKTSPLVRRTTYTLSLRNLKDRSIRGNVANATARFQYTPVASRKASAAKTAHSGAEPVPVEEGCP